MSQKQISKAEELLELITAPVSSSNQKHGPQPGPQELVGNKISTDTSVLKDEPEKSENELATGVSRSALDQMSHIPGDDMGIIECHPFLMETDTKTNEANLIIPNSPDSEPKYVHALSQYGMPEAVTNPSFTNSETKYDSIMMIKTSLPDPVVNPEVSMTKVGHLEKLDEIETKDTVVAKTVLDPPWSGNEEKSNFYDSLVNSSQMVSEIKEEPRQLDTISGACSKTISEHLENNDWTVTNSERNMLPVIKTETYKNVELNEAVANNDVVVAPISLHLHESVTHLHMTESGMEVEVSDSAARSSISSQSQKRDELLEYEEIKSELKACKQELVSTKSQLTKVERQLVKANNYNEDLRKQVETLSAEIHRYRHRTTEDVDVQVDKDELIQYATGELILPDWGTTGQEGQYTTDPSINETATDQAAGGEKLSIADSLKATAEAVVMEQSGFVYDQNSGLYYDYNTGYYYDNEKSLYYDPNSGTYFYYNHETSEYQFHSQVDVTCYQWQHQSGASSQQNEARGTTQNNLVQNQELSSQYDIISKEDLKKAQKKRKKEKKKEKDKDEKVYQNRKERREALKMKLEAKRKKREKREKKERKKHRKHKRNKDEKRKSENCVEDKMRKRHKKKKHKSRRDCEGEGDVGDVIEKVDSADIQHGAENVENEAVSDILQILNERLSKDGETVTDKTEKVLKHKRDTLEKGVRVESEIIDVNTDMVSATASTMNDKGPLGMENECKEEFMETDAHENHIDPNLNKLCDNHTEKEAKLVKDNKPGKENIKMHELSEIVDNNDEHNLNDKHELENDITDRITVEVKASHKEKGKDKVKREDASERSKGKNEEKKDGNDDSDVEIVEVRQGKRKHRSRSERHRSIIISSESESETESGEISESESSSSDTESVTHLSRASSSNSDMSDSSSEDDMDDKHERAGGWPPCIRVIVTESNCLSVGTLFIVTCTGATVGREKDMNHTIRIPDLSVSKMHAEIHFDKGPGQYEIIDKGSQNGTFINDKRIAQAKERSEATPVNHGDVLQLGDTKLLCHIHSGSDTCIQCEPGIVIANHTANHPQKEIAVLSKEEKKQQQKKQLKQIKMKYGLKNAAYVDNTKAINNPLYTDKASERRKTVGSDGPETVKREVPASVHRPISRENVGHKLLKKMGWAEGESLGRENTGIQEPVTVSMRANQNAGLGASSSAVFSPDDANSIDIRKATRRVQAQQRFSKIDTSAEGNRSEKSKMNKWTKGETQFAQGGNG